MTQERISMGIRFGILTQKTRYGDGNIGLEFMLSDTQETIALFSTASGQFYPVTTQHGWSLRQARHMLAQADKAWEEARHVQP